MVDLRIRGGTVWTSDGFEHADILIDEGQIVGLVAGDFPVEAKRVVDATGSVVLPGMIDVHVHTREPGYTHKEDITTATAQAAAGGVTTIFGMPNLQPPTTDLETLEEVFRLYEQKAIVDWNHNPVPSFGQVDALAEAGIRAFKVYMVVDTGRTYPHPAGTGMHAHGDLLRAMDDIARTGLRFMIHPHDQSVMDYIEGSYLEKGQNTPAAYAQAYAAREGVIWDTACDVILRLSEAAACPLHIVHMQTRRSIEAVRRAKQRGLDVTCEVNPWALFLSRWEDIERLGPYALSYWVPDDARDAVWEGVRDGTIDLLASDHAPHTREEKEIGWTEMWSAHTGTPGIQFQYPLLLDAVKEGKLPMHRAIDMVATKPAAAFGLSGRKGALRPGLDADIVIVDLDAPWTITNDSVLSRCGWTPYDGRSCSARIERTFVRGSEVFGDGKVIGTPGSGKRA